MHYCPCVCSKLSLLPRLNFNIPWRQESAWGLIYKTDRKNLRLSARWLWRVRSSGMLHRVDLVKTDVSEECVAYIFGVERIREREALWLLGHTASDARRRRSWITWSVDAICNRSWILLNFNYMPLLKLPNCGNIMYFSSWHGAKICSFLLVWRVWSNAAVAMQPKVKHLHRYAHVTVLLCCIATNSGKVECFYWGSPIL
jgi:hypothetical protein